jgi:hypothetical protein
LQPSPKQALLSIRALRKVTKMQSEWHQRLTGDGWKASVECFWNGVPCFYDLGTIKTVILFVASPGSASVSGYDATFYWKYGLHDLPDYLAQERLEIRRYRLHHSMNALLWHDHGERVMWPA